MSGICGMVHFDGAPVQEAALRGMAEAAAHRGPDGLHLECLAAEAPDVPIAGFAYLALRLTPEEQREVQPLRRSALLLAVHARLDNRNELIAALTARGALRAVGAPAGVAPTDAELILAAYRRWGTGCAGRLLGDFAFALWDDERKRLFAARDPMAMRPLYYRREPDRLLFASEVKQLLAAPDVPRRLSEPAVAAHLAGRFDRLDRTFYEDISQLEPGYALLAYASGCRTWCYWDVDPSKQLLYRTEEAYAEHFLELFEEALRCRLRSIFPVGLLLSGGVDSTSVAATAGRLLERDTAACPSFRTYSWAFDELAQCDERVVSAPIARRYDLPATYVDAEAAAPLEHYPADTPDGDEPFAGVYDVLIERALHAAHAEGVRRMLTGHRGDLVVGEWIFDYLGLLRTGRWFTLWRELQDHTRNTGMPLGQTVDRYLRSPIRKALWPKGRAAWLRAPLRRAYRVLHPAPPPSLYPAWVRPGFARRTGLDDAPSTGDLPFGLHGHARQQRYRAAFMPMHMRTAVWFERNCARAGLDCADPWSDRRLVEFAVSVPQRALSRAGDNKRIARQAMRGIMPEQARRNAGKTNPKPLYERALRERAQDTVRTLITGSHAAARGYVDEDALRTYYERYRRGETEEDHRFWYTLTLEMWLRRYGDDSRIEG